MHLLENGPQVPLWLDCDPGNDDAFAILLAAFSPRFRLVGISTVHGNVLLEKTSHNATALLDVLGFHQNDIPVYAGSARPLKIDPIHAEDIHGVSGISGYDLPQFPSIKLATDKDYLAAMKDAIMDNSGHICVVCTGALTNFANLLEKFPQVGHHIRFVSIMGGAIQSGNITPSSEFNVHCDPHAAALVFSNPLLANKIVLCPLNITHTVLATDEVMTCIYNENGTNNSEVRRMYSQILNSYAHVYRRKYGNYVGPPVHDPLAVFLVLAMVARDTPKLAKFAAACDFHYLQRKLQVVLEGENAGETIIESGNLDPLLEEKGGVYVGFGVNAQFFWAHVFQALEMADARLTSLGKVCTKQSINGD